MKGGVGAHVLANKANSTPPPKHMSKRGNGKPGQTFSPQRLEVLCRKHGMDPGEVWAKGLQRWEAKFDGVDFSIPEGQPKAATADQWADYLAFLDAVQKMMDYTYGKKRAVEVSGEVQHSHRAEDYSDDELAAIATSSSDGTTEATDSTQELH